MPKCINFKVKRYHSSTTGDRLHEINLISSTLKALQSWGCWLLISVVAFMDSVNAILISASAIAISTVAFIDLVSAVAISTVAFIDLVSAIAILAIAFIGCVYPETTNRYICNV
ncbi:hypothetical protein [Chlorogloeopsis sp. ULAP02]|uniref:hypothetical protein n=1 Tax=Chlorogloeopsis sp. ULAP02 TaxID=3107926 RepID=UPI00313593D1